MTKNLHDVMLTQEEYDDLLDDQVFLEALRRAGVDNWDGYEEALDIYNGENQD